MWLGRFLKSLRASRWWDGASLLLFSVGRREWNILTAFSFPSAKVTFLLGLALTLEGRPSFLILLWGANSILVLNRLILFHAPFWWG